MTHRDAQFKSEIKLCVWWRFFLLPLFVAENPEVTAACPHPPRASSQAKELLLGLNSAAAFVGRLRHI